MRNIKLRTTPLFVLYLFLTVMLSSCSQYSASNVKVNNVSDAANYPPYESRIPQSINVGNEKVIVIDPKVHVWGAYGPDGHLIRAGLATAGANWCPDIKRACRTSAGSYRIQSLGSANCKSTIYPIPKGGAPMPYCMFFNGHQGLHGSPYVVEGNVSHGCVRLPVSDAEWIRYNFATIGTKVIVKPY